MRLLNIKEVTAIVGVHRATIYRQINAGDFPVAIKAGPRAVRWRADEIEAWIESRERATGELVEIGE